MNAAGSDGELTVALFEPSSKAWAAIARDIIRLEQEAFGEGAFEPDYLEFEFTQRENTIVLLLERDGTVAGFTCAVPASYVDDSLEYDLTDTAHIIDTIIDQRHQKQGLVGALMDVLESALRQRGYTYIEREAAVNNGYAASIARAYAGRIAYQSEPHDSEWGPQIAFRIRL